MALRRFRLRLEPYNPDARDADGDGIVQEGTAWERPAGTRILNQLGEEVARGEISSRPRSGFQIVDRDGKAVDYIPSYAKRAKIPTERPKTSLEKRGFQTIEGTGVTNVAGLVSEAFFVSRMLSSGRRDLPDISQPYDPNARDETGQGLLQPGTIWERPIGSKILARDGSEMFAGRLSPFRDTSWQTVDARGNPLKFVPSYGIVADFDSQDSGPTLERIGVQSLRSMGIRTVGDMVLPSTRETTSPDLAQVPANPDVPKPRYPRLPPAHAMTGRAEEVFGQAKTWQEFREIMKDTDIVFLDYETTGIVFDEYGRASSNGRPTQIGAVRMRDGKVIDRFNVFVNPGMPMSEWEQWSRDNLTDSDGKKLTDSFFDDKPSIAEAHRQLLDFIGPGAILGMQNAVFDDAVLGEALGLSGIDWRPEGIIDTKEMSSMVLPRWTPEKPDGPNRVDSRTGETVPSNGLADITRYLGVDLGDKHHSADYDAEATGHVLTRIVEGAIANNWSNDFLDKEKRDSKIAANEAKFNQEIAKFEEDRRSYLRFIGMPQEDDAVPSITPDIAEPQNADEAVREFLRQVESGEFPYPLDENEIAEEIFQIRESFTVEEVTERTDDATEQVLSRSRDISDSKNKAIIDVKKALDDAVAKNGTFDQTFSFGSVDADFAEQASEEGFDLTDGEKFAMSLVDLFAGEITARDGSTVEVRPTSVSAVEDDDYAFGEGTRYYFIVYGMLVDADGNSIGTFSRKVRIGKFSGMPLSPYIEHSTLIINGGKQNNGVGTAFNTQMEQVYREIGASVITASAVSALEWTQTAEGRQSGDVTHIGGTHWVRNGFTWRTKRDRANFINLLDDLVDFDPQTGVANPTSKVYIEGVSTGPSPSKRDRQIIAYFETEDEWNSFINRFRKAKTESFDDPDSVIPGDLVRWRGADDYFAGQEASFELIRKLYGEAK